MTFDFFGLVINAPTLHQVASVIINGFCMRPTSNWNSEKSLKNFFLHYVNSCHDVKLIPNTESQKNWGFLSAIDIETRKNCKKPHYQEVSCIWKLHKHLLQHTCKPCSQPLEKNPQPPNQTQTYVSILKYSAGFTFAVQVKRSVTYTDHDIKPIQTRTESLWNKHIFTELCIQKRAKFYVR